MKTVPELVKERLSERHSKPEVRNQLLKRLQFAIKKATEDSIDTDEIPKKETVSAHIKIKKLSQNCEDEELIQINGRKKFYSGIIVHALHSLMDENMEYYRGYDCCEYVEFLEPIASESSHRQDDC